MVKPITLDPNIISLLGASWAKKLQSEFGKSYMHEISKFVKARRLVTKVFPSGDNVFNAYKLTPFEDVRVVILGQD